MKSTGDVRRVDIINQQLNDKGLRLDSIGDKCKN